jgi:DNA-binding transcriptional MerR regulator
MLTIGRFADATGLTVKALRHYDELGLLVPARVDLGNGYRYYEPAQIEDGVAVRRLRALELPLEEIRELLAADADGVRVHLAAHGYRVAAEAHDKHMLLIELAALLEGGGETVELAVVDVPELRLAATIRHLALVDPEGVEAMLRELRPRVEPVGPPVALFRGGDGEGMHIVEAGYPVAEGGRVYPAAQAAVHEHRGSYDGLHVTAQRFIATVLGQGLAPAQPIRIEYVELDRLARIVWPLASS